LSCADIQYVDHQLKQTVVVGEVVGNLRWPQHKVFAAATISCDTHLSTRLWPRSPVAALCEGATRKHPAPRHHFPGAWPGTPGGGTHSEGTDPQGTLDLPTELPPGGLVDASTPSHSGQVCCLQCSLWWHIRSISSLFQI